MTREEAEALAAKREAHKGRSLYTKEWRAVHNSVKGWHVALVDSALRLHQKADAAVDIARDAFRRGDIGSFMDAASDALIARCKAQLAADKARGK